MKHNFGVRYTETLPFPIFLVDTFQMKLVVSLHFSHLLDRIGSKTSPQPE